MCQTLWDVHICETKHRSQTISKTAELGGRGSALGSLLGPRRPLFRFSAPNSRPQSGAFSPSCVRTRAFVERERSGGSRDEMGNIFRKKHQWWGPGGDGKAGFGDLEVLRLSSMKVKGTGIGKAARENLMVFHWLLSCLLEVSANSKTKPSSLSLSLYIDQPSQTS